MSQVALTTVMKECNEMCARVVNDVMLDVKDRLLNESSIHIDPQTIDDMLRCCMCCHVHRLYTMCVCLYVLSVCTFVLCICVCLHIVYCVCVHVVYVCMLSVCICVHVCKCCLCVCLSMET